MAKRFCSAAKSMDVSIEFAILAGSSLERELQSVGGQEFCVFSFASYDEALDHYEKAQGSRFVAVVPGGEYSVEYAWKISRFLKLDPGIDGDVRATRDKFLMRKHCEAVGICQPMLYGKFSSLGDIVALEDLLRFPVVVKPLNRCGSQNVKICYDQQQLKAHAQEILIGGISTTSGLAHIKQGIVEEYILGAEYSIECALSSGQIVYGEVTRKYTSKGANRQEVGHFVEVHEDMPARILGRNLCRSIALAFGVRSGILHIEFIVVEGKAYLVEFGARLPGGLITDLHERVFGNSLEQVWLGLSLRKRKTLVGENRAWHAGGVGVLHVRDGFRVPPLPNNMSSIEVVEYSRTPRSDQHQPSRRLSIVVKCSLLQFEKVVNRIR
ncbi:ATP-grasp domain-containing protein [Roseobacter weihaiensis]|uniref:ATP-grasp domain-containing protein n=1 Tax=Roseobacter weihaiensis TaxID=2763262 RepID=UPI001D09BCED|nr:ATP-grasp domain-containing protein [Roseobacter sp. H9]